MAAPGRSRLALTPAQRALLLRETERSPPAVNGCASLRFVGEAMRRAVPKPGGDWKRLVGVLLEPGEPLARHHHEEHTVVYYPEGLSVDPVIVIGGEPHRPAPNEILYLPPGTAHAVPAHAERRLTVAMLVEK